MSPTTFVQVLRAQEAALEAAIHKARVLECLLGDESSPKHDPLALTVARKHVDALLATRRSLAQQIALLVVEDEARAEVAS